MLDQILTDLIEGVPGATAAIFLDGEGEAIAQAGSSATDIRLLGAWKEIHLDSIREITNRLGLGGVHAVLFSFDHGNELLAPVTSDYCLLLLMSTYTDIKKAIEGLAKAIDLLKKDVE